MIRFKWIGTMDVPEVAAMMDWCAEVQEASGVVFLIMDLTDAGAVTSAGRRCLVNYAKQRPMNGVALFGASYRMKVLISLIVNALNVLRKETQAFEFCETEQAALGAIARMQGDATTIPPVTPVPG